MSHPHWRQAKPAIALAICSLAYVAALTIRLPRPDEPTALLLAPGLSAEGAFRAVAALDGTPVRAGGWSNIIVATFDRPIALSSLWRHGVWLAFDPFVLGACAPGPDPTQGDGAALSGTTYAQ